MRGTTNRLHCWIIESQDTENTVSSNDYQLLNSVNLNYGERGFCFPTIRYVYHLPLQKVFAVQVHCYCCRIGKVDVADSEIHRMVLQIHDLSISCLRNSSTYKTTFHRNEHASPKLPFLNSYPAE